MGLIKLPKTFTKEEEISVLLALAGGGTYFADAFTRDDAQQMMTNIRNDFPLLMGTRVGTKISELEGNVVDLTKTIGQLTYDNFNLKDSEQKLKEENGILRDKLEQVFTELLKNGGDDLNLYSFLSMEAIVRLKLKNNLALDQAERDMITGLLNEKK